MGDLTGLVLPVIDWGEIFQGVGPRPALYGPVLLLDVLPQHRERGASD